MKVRREKPEDFVGWKSEDGLLEVTEVMSTGRTTKFKVVCQICSNDRELFPDGYFISNKSNLKKQKKPCSCSKCPKWTSYQFLVLSTRVGKTRGFIVRGFSERFHGQDTRVDCICTKDGHEWKPTVASIINSKSGCPLCGFENISKALRHTPEKVESGCIKLCIKYGYRLLGFPNNYKNWLSKLHYECPVHGVFDTTYNNFINGKKCPLCADYGYNPSKQGSFYVVKWTKENQSFIKFGITNREVSVRIEEQGSDTYFKPEILFSATFIDGRVPLNIERSIKNNSEFRKGVISKEEFPDGFTETVESDCLYELEDFITVELIKQEG